jgi:4'-phosphopantetheinyl transferase
LATHTGGALLQVGPEHLQRQQRELLTQQELDYVHSAGDTAVRRARTVSRALLRSTLARYLGEPPQSLRFAANPHGKPELVHPSSLGQRLQFNITHTESIVGE